MEHPNKHSCNKYKLLQINQKHPPLRALKQYKLNTKPRSHLQKPKSKRLCNSRNKSCVKPL